MPNRYQPQLAVFCLIGAILAFTSCSRPHVVKTVPPLPVQKPVPPEAPPDLTLGKSIAHELKSDASEGKLKSVHRPLLLHIATHGCFLQGAGFGPRGSKDRNLELVEEKNAPDTKSLKTANPLSRSMLFFAGANGGKSGEDDGVLTALEAAGLDLWGTKLVALSACDTGLGEVQNGDGVYGMRRGLVLAGSETQMMSLWPVSDQGTRDLMGEYYHRLKSGEGRSSALRQIRLEFLNHPKRKHPYYWAGFIQSGEWANLDGKR